MSATAQPLDLPTQIKNIPCTSPYSVGTNVIAYKTGHHDAIKAVLVLLAQARASQPEGAAGTTGASVKSWQERMGPGYIDGGADLPEEVAMKAEIADLRAQLAAKGRGTAVAKVIINDGSGTATVMIAPDAELSVGASLYLAAPASAQLDRGAAQDDTYCATKAREVGLPAPRTCPTCKLGPCRFAAPSPASQPVAPETAQGGDELDHRETVLRVQGLLGITQTGWVSPDVIELRIEQLKKAAHAQQEASPALTVWYGAMPESNGKSNFTATLKRKGASMFDTDSYTFARSEYPDRVRYDADCMRYLIGELAERPDILDYDDDKHSGYVAPIAAAPPSDAKDATVPDHSEREAANADVLLAALRQAERAFGNYDRHLDDVNAMAAIRAALASAGEVCKHRRQTTTALGAATGSGWTCKDCGELLSYTQAPDQSPATIAAGQEAANAKDAARYRMMKENDFTAEYCDYIGDCLNERETVDFDATIDAAMAAVGAAGQEGGNHA